MNQNKKKIFISYSRHDIEHKNTLLKHLSGLRDDVITWNDRDIPPGEEWDDRIKQELQQADIVLYLVSANSVATEYIQKVELPLIEQRCNSKECVLIPIIVDFCKWERLDFSKYNALPDKGAPITDRDHWVNENQAWLAVINGIERIIDAMPEKPRQKAFLKDFKDDIIIHAAEADSDFAKTFKAELQKHLAQKLEGHGFRLRLQTNAESLNSVAVVINLLSDAYLQEHGDIFETLPQLQDKRLILAEASQTKKPDCLSGIAEYPFWQVYKGDVVTYKNTDSIYQLAMDDLTSELKTRLKQLKKTEVVLEQLKPIASTRRNAVFINVAPEEDDLDFASKLQAELSRHNFISTLPASTGTRTDIENKYRYCQIVVFVYFQASDEWLGQQILACHHAENELQKSFIRIDICTNKEQSHRIKEASPFIKTHLFPPEDFPDYASGLGSSLP